MVKISSSHEIRLNIVDQIRGSAIIGVVLFHLVWDLDFTNIIGPGYATHPLWIAFGRLLAGTFMFLVGVSLVLANRHGILWVKAAKRILVIVVCAGLISIGTYLAFPSAFIFYGILHAIAVASVVGLLVVHRPPKLVLGLGAAIWLVPFLVSDAAFDTRWLAWIGFSQTSPPSNDLVPIFPWLGITLVGIALTHLGLRSGLDRRVGTTQPGGRTGRFLNFCGRQSLVIYLLHQPILLGLIIPIASFLRS